MMHRNSAGFIQLPLIAYGAIGAAVVIIGLGIACKVQTSRLEALRQEYEQFKGGVEALGLAAKKAAAEKEAADIKRKADTDDLHRKAVDALTADLRRLRNEHTRGGGLSSPGAPAGSPDRACFDPAQLAGALRSLDEGVLGIVETGAKAVIDLDAAKRWAQTK
jgi:hypothetical protein